KRLYELTFGATKIARSAAHAICPARYCLKTSDSPANAASPPRHSDEWMWHDEPTHVWSGFAMNVTERPCWCAIAFSPVLKIAWSSAAFSASAYLKLSSCWPGHASPFEPSTTM